MKSFLKYQHGSLQTEFEVGVSCSEFSSLPVPQYEDSCTPRDTGHPVVPLCFLSIAAAQWTSAAISTVQPGLEAVPRQPRALNMNPSLYLLAPARSLLLFSVHMVNSFTQRKKITEAKVTCRSQVGRILYSLLCFSLQLEATSTSFCSPAFTIQSSPLLS